MNVMTSRSERILENPKTVKGEQKSEVEGVAKEMKYTIEIPREEDKGVEEPLCRGLTRECPTQSKPYKPPIPYPHRLIKARDEKK